MAKTKKTTENKPALTRAGKTEATKNIIRELLANGAVKSNDLIDGAAGIYAERFGGEDTENPNDVKGRMGSVINVMKKDGEITFEGGVYAMKAEISAEVPAETQAEPKEETPKKRTARAKKEKTVAESAEEVKTEEKPKAKRAARKKTAKAEAEAPAAAEEAKEKTAPLPPAPLQPIAPVDPVTPEVAPEPMPEQTEQPEKPAPKKRGRKAKKEEPTVKATEEKTERPTVEKTETVKEEKIAEKIPKKEEEKKSETVKEEEKAAPTLAPAPQPVVMDMSFLFGDVKPAKKAIAERAESRSEARPEPKKTEVKAEENPAPKKEELPALKQPEKTPEKQEKRAGSEKDLTREEKPKKQEKESVQKNVRESRRGGAKQPARIKTADEKLQEAFLNRLHRLGGDYFEYYSVYLLEKYSRMNGRRLEGLKICGGDHDGGIDGEIELSDRLGFKETIYIQAKNWDPDKGDERLWVVGETLLQQFIGACVCRQARDGKQHCRGIFITTSRFTPEAKRLLDETSDKFVGYDGADLYETAKECQFGLIKKNGEWALDEELLSGEKAFFRMF